MSIVTYYDLKGLEFVYPAKTFMCRKQKKEAYPEFCYNCFSSMRQKKHTSRVLCKQDNMDKEAVVKGMKVRVIAIDDQRKVARLQRLIDKTVFERKTDDVLDIVNKR